MTLRRTKCVHYSHSSGFHQFLTLHISISYLFRETVTSILSCFIYFNFLHLGFFCPNQDPAYTHYKRLNCELQPLDTTCEEFELVNWQTLWTGVTVLSLTAIFNHSRHILLSDLVILLEQNL